MGNLGRKLRRRRDRERGKHNQAVERQGGFTPEQMRQILEEGNSAELVEFVGVRCLHNPAGSVMSFETYQDHVAAGCRPTKVAHTYAGLVEGRPAALPRRRR